MSHQDESLSPTQIVRALAEELVIGSVLVVVSFLLLPLIAVVAVLAVVASALAWLYVRIKNEPSKGRHTR